MPVQPTSIFERAERYIMPEPMSGCWLWYGAVDGRGYGQISTKSGQSPARAHRVVYEKYRGPIPDGLDLDHKCRNIVCVNPDHLEPVTRAENLRRGIGILRRKERAAMVTHCHNGHSKAENWYISPKGKRHCRVCQKQRDAKYRGAP